MRSRGGELTKFGGKTLISRPMTPCFYGPHYTAWTAARAMNSEKVTDLHRGKYMTMMTLMEFASRQTIIGGLPRPEYPRPQFVRSDWLNLNGLWQFGIGKPDVEPTKWQFDRTIVVPFAPESKASGVEHTGFMRAVRYQRLVTIPDEWAGRRVLLHVGAADFDTTVWVGDTEVGRHRGGFTSFEFDITDALDGCSFLVSILVEDDPGAIEARGKQSRRLENYQAFYTRTTGIWQTVWLEPVSPSYFGRPKIIPDPAMSQFTCDVKIVRPTSRLDVRVDLYDDSGLVSSSTVSAVSRVEPHVVVNIPSDRLRLWSPDDPYLYRLHFCLTDQGRVIDELESYAGMRSVSIDGRKMLLNGRPVFERLVLDQGYWPDSLMTAPTDSDLVKDIMTGKKAGFNGARLHQKVVEERYLFHADRLGYLVWGEFADWGARVPGTDRQEPTMSFVSEWVEAVTRDFSHPSIIGWCPLNETFEPLHDHLTLLDDATRALYSVTKAIDPTRPVLDASGYSHRVIADVYDSHLYEQDPAEFARLMGGLENNHPYTNTAADGIEWSVPYAGQPYFCSEFGGIWWCDDEIPSEESWGYGQAPITQEEWIDRFRRLVDVLLDDPNMFGYCFTQLTDVFQEKNGIVTFDRIPKFDLDRLKTIQSRPAASESPTQMKPSHKSENNKTGKHGPNIQ